MNKLILELFKMQAVLFAILSLMGFLSSGSFHPKDWERFYNFAAVTLWIMGNIIFLMIKSNQRKGL